MRPQALFDKVEQVVRLIRSKGVGVYFITQNPIDIPEKIAGQLGNRVQHALRAFTPRDQKAIRAAAETFRINPDLDVETAITELKVGEALVSTLDEDGAPTIVQRTLIAPPRSRLGPVSDKERAIIQSISPFDGKYDSAVDREIGRRSAGAEGAGRRRRPRRWSRNRARRPSAPSRAQTPTMWEKAGKAAIGAAAASAGGDDRAHDDRAQVGRIAAGLGGQRDRGLARHRAWRRGARPLRARPAGRAAALNRPRAALAGVACWRLAAIRPDAGRCEDRARAAAARDSRWPSPPAGRLAGGVTPSPTGST